MSVSKELFKLKDIAENLASRCDSLLEEDDQKSEEIERLELRLVEQAVEFERRRDRFRTQMNSLRDRNRLLEGELLEMQKQVNSLLETSVGSLSSSRATSWRPLAAAQPRHRACGGGAVDCRVVEHRAGAGAGTRRRCCACAATSAARAIASAGRATASSSAAFARDGATATAGSRASTAAAATTSTTAASRASTAAASAATASATTAAAAAAGDPPCGARARCCRAVSAAVASIRRSRGGGGGGGGEEPPAVVARCW